METAKMNAKRTAVPATTTATTPRKSCLYPKELLIYSFTGSLSPSVISFSISPNCDAINPYKVQAIGHAQ